MIEYFTDFTYSIVFIGLLIGSFTDLKKREVPDWLNYGLVAVGLFLNLLFSIAFWDYRYIAGSVLGFAAFFMLALIMYYTGQWGGGDSKMLMGIGAILGINIWEGNTWIMLSFLINLLFFGAAYGLVWTIALAIRNGKKFIKELIKANRNPNMRITKILLLALLIASFVVFKLNKSILTVYLLFLCFMGSVIFYLWIFIKIIEKVCMLKYVAPEKLTEGDWIAKDIRVKGQYLAGPKDLGIEKKQIEKLIKLKVRKVLIKEGIPFVPSFLIAFIVSVLFGNVLMWFL